MSSLLCMPLLIMNMGGEMIYILEQRLHAQKIPTDKSRRVLRDVVSTMFNSKFVNELFRPQAIYSNVATRQIFDRLAHSSIMRLNESSMDKLYDLMTMGFKHQVLGCTHPSQLLDVTMNHLNALKVIVAAPAAIELVDLARRLSVETYGSMTPGQLYNVKHTLCRFFQDRRVKVSLFLQDGLQNLDGNFVIKRGAALPDEMKTPGRVRYFGADGDVETSAAFESVAADALDSSEGDDSPPLGSNLYSKDRPPRKKGAAAAAAASKLSEDGPEEDSKSDSSGKAKEDDDDDDDRASRRRREGKATAGEASLNMLASLLGTSSAGDGGGAPIISLFGDDPYSDSEPSAGYAKADVIVIDTVRGTSRASLMADLDLDDDGPSSKAGADDEDDDLLSLMDSAM